MEIVPNKKIRAKIITDYCIKSGITEVVCYEECKTTIEFLNSKGISVLSIKQNNREPEKIRMDWPYSFDASPGNIPLFLIMRIAKKYKEFLTDLEKTMSSKDFITVPYITGETITCLQIAYPNITFKPKFIKGNQNEES